ncbi:hypothetical protein ACFQ6Q_03650 [Streptomyces sp. NPDC056437]|uniref:hypothetical protein n=1 Tax=Streptomyces sp. NPDC056437 TaxID=3345816 RepID=UPI0036A05A6B
MTPSPVPTTAPAFEHPPTAVGYRRLMLRRRMWLAAFLCLLAVLVWIAAELSLPDRAIPLFIVVLLLCPVLVLASAAALLCTPRTARILQSYVWQEYPCSYPPRGQRRDFVVVVTVAPGHEVTLHTTPYRHNLQHKRDPHPGVIWFAGDPHSGGVVSPVGGHAPLRVASTALWDRDPQLPPADAVAERAGLARDGRYVRRWF